MRAHISYEFMRISDITKHSKTSCIFHVHVIQYAAVIYVWNPTIVYAGCSLFSFYNCGRLYGDFVAIDAISIIYLGCPTFTKWQVAATNFTRSNQWIPFVNSIMRGPSVGARSPLQVASADIANWTTVPNTVYIWNRNKSMAHISHMKYFLFMGDYHGVVSHYNSAALRLKTRMKMSTYI